MEVMHCQDTIATSRTRPVANGSNPLLSERSSARMEMKVDAHGVAPVPKDEIHFGEFGHSGHNMVSV